MKFFAGGSRTAGVWSMHHVSAAYRDEDGLFHAFHGDRRFMEWIRANDLDPTTVTDLVIDGDLIVVTEITRDAQGRVVLNMLGNIAKNDRTVPLKVPLPECMWEVH